MEEFSKALQLRPGVTSIIGGGGKTTLLYRLAAELGARTSVIVTTSTHIWMPKEMPFLERTKPVQGVICVGTPCENGKLTAPQQRFEELTALAEYVLVEADGSAGKPLKAHAPHEPVIPKNSNNIICVVGARGINRMISEAVHRPERFCALAHSTIATVQAVAAVLETERLHDRVFINQADTPECIAAAKSLASMLSCPVTIASLRRGEILCSC